jgi:hypothetical protein
MCLAITNTNNIAEVNQTGSDGAVRSPLFKLVNFLLFAAFPPLPVSPSPDFRYTYPFVESECMICKGVFCGSFPYSQYLISELILSMQIRLRLKHENGYIALL